MNADFKGFSDDEKESLRNALHRRDPDRVSGFILFVESACKSWTQFQDPAEWETRRKEIKKIKADIEKSIDSLGTLVRMDHLFIPKSFESLRLVENEDWEKRPFVHAPDYRNPELGDKESRPRRARKEWKVSPWKNIAVNATKELKLLWGYLHEAEEKFDKGRRTPGQPKARITATGLVFEIAELFKAYFGEPPTTYDDGEFAAILEVIQSSLGLPEKDLTNAIRQAVNALKN